MVELQLLDPLQLGLCRLRSLQQSALQHYRQRESLLLGHLLKLLCENILNAVS